jgi:hypothetical protein
LGRKAPEQVVEQPAEVVDVVARADIAGVRQPAQARTSVIADEYVAGIDATVHDADLVQVRERGGDRGAEASHMGQGSRPPRHGVAGEPSAQLAVGGEGVGPDDCDEAGVTCRPQTLRLEVEPGAVVVGGGRLDRDRPVVIVGDPDEHAHDPKHAE